MKFINITEKRITKVMLDLEGLVLSGLEQYTPEDTVCVFEEVRNFDFTIVNEFLATLTRDQLSSLANSLVHIRKVIAKYGNDDPAADKCAIAISWKMKTYHPNFSNLFSYLYDFSGKYVTPDKTDSRPQEAAKTWYAKDRQMLVAASLLSALCIMVIHDFKTHFTDVSEPLQILYLVFEEVILDSDVDGVKEFVNRNRELVSQMDDDVASWILKGIYINDCMLHKHDSLPADVYVVEHITQRILSSKTYFAGKRAREMKDVHEAEAQQRNDAKSESTEEKFERVYPDIKDLAIITALMIKQAILFHYGSNPTKTCSLYCAEVVKAVNKVINDINAPASFLATRSFGWKGIYDPKAMVYDIYNAIGMCIDKQKFKNEVLMLPFVNDGNYIQYSAIEGAITDALLMMRRIHDYLMSQEHSGLRQPHIPYDTLRCQQAALTTIAPKLNPEFGPLIVSLVLASSNIDMQALYRCMTPQQSMFGQPMMQQPMYGQPGQMPMYNPYAQKPAFQLKKTDKS